MSLYNMMHGVDPATFFILPMLGKHPDEYPRFRDCFTEEREFVLEDDKLSMKMKLGGRRDVICVFCRVGGSNREPYHVEIKTLQAMDGYITDYNDRFDRTFALFVFKVPEKWKADYDKIVAGNMAISEEYKQEIYRVYPLLTEELDRLFARAEVGK